MWQNLPVATLTGGKKDLNSAPGGKYSAYFPKAGIDPTIQRGMGTFGEEH